MEWDSRRQQVEKHNESEGTHLGKGLVAYAARQAALFRGLCNRFRHQWNISTIAGLAETDKGREPNSVESSLHFAVQGVESDDEAVNVGLDDSDNE